MGNGLNKKILIITYYWPPSGGAAVQRWLSLANELTRLGWEVFLLTVDKKYATYQLYDESLEKEIDENIKVFTTKTSEPFGLYKFLFGKKSIPKPAFANETSPSLVKKISRFIRGNFFIPDPRKGWTPYAVKKATELIKENKIPVVVTAGPPHSTHSTGKKLKEKLNIKWVVDFHDLWTDVIYYDMLYHLPFVKKIDKKLENQILESADKIITVGEEYKKKLLSKTKFINEDKIHISRIGYDGHLFSDNRKTAQSAFIITYAGSMADFYKPEVFFIALAETVKKFPHTTFKIKFVGVVSAGIKQFIISLGLGNILEETGYLPHHEAVKEISASTVLLLVNPVTKDEAMVIPGKIYEYLAAGKPIINITKPEAETAALIEENKAGKTFDRNKPEEIATYLEELEQKWEAEKSLDMVTAGVKKYSRSEIAVKLSENLLLPLIS